MKIVGPPGFVKKLKTRALERDLANVNAANDHHKHGLSEALKEIARLKVVIKKSEWSGSVQSESACPWCREWEHASEGRAAREHAPDCPAFTPDGVVK